MGDLTNNILVSDIKTILHSAKTFVYQTINSTMTTTYWEIGRRIVQEEQEGEQRAKYGKALLKTLSEELTKDKLENEYFIKLWKVLRRNTRRVKRR